jgi:hypothetical protein
MRKRTGVPLTLLVVAFALALGACGDDDEPSGSATTTEQTDSAATETATTDTETETAPDDDNRYGGSGGGLTAPSKDSGEAPPEGAGDEVPASSQALITGRDGRLRPSVVHVPPFIAVRVELVSADGVEYELTGGGKTVKAGGEIRSASTLLPGVRAGQRIILTGPQGKVTIVADAEPGP